MKPAWPFSSERSTKEVADGARPASGLFLVTAGVVLVMAGLLQLNTPEQGTWPTASLLALGLTLAVVGLVLPSARAWPWVVGGAVLIALGALLWRTADFVWFTGSVLLVVGAVNRARRAHRVGASPNSHERSSPTRS